MYYTIENCEKTLKLYTKYKQTRKYGEKRVY